MSQSEPITLSILVAVAADGAIGKDGKLLWRLNNDMRFFKNTTWAMPVVMGRKTYESLGKPLQGRQNVVVSRTAHQTEGIVVASSLNEALEKAAAMRTREIFIIGGAQIYQEALPLVHRLYYTRVQQEFPDADVHFPPVDWSAWKQVKQQSFKADEKNDYDHQIEIWERR